MVTWNDRMLNLCLHEGAVFYIQDRELTSPHSHFFVVLNKDPASDNFLVMAVSTSQVEKRKKAREQLPSETLVEISPSEYRDFTKHSLIDCNQVFERSKHQLIEQLRQRGEQKQSMPNHIVVKLREGVQKSPLISPETKKRLV